MKPASCEVEVPTAIMDLARRRTDFLFRHIQYSPQPMWTHLASAYVQGMTDAVEALDAAKRIK